MQKTQALARYTSSSILALYQTIKYLTNVGNPFKDPLFAFSTIVLSPRRTLLEFGVWDEAPNPMTLAKSENLELVSTVFIILLIHQHFCVTCKMAHEEYVHLIPHSKVFRMQR